MARHGRMRRLKVLGEVQGRFAYFAYALRFPYRAVDSGGGRMLHLPATTAWRSRASQGRPACRGKTEGSAMVRQAKLG